MRNVTSLWDVYLDVDDAATVLDACAVLERARAVREPLPLEDAARLLARLRTIADVCKEEAVHWRREADDRRADADVDGGRWGSVAVAMRMHDIAARRAVETGEIAEAADTAARHLAPRLTQAPPPETHVAADATAREVQRLIERREDP